MEYSALIFDPQSGCEALPVYRANLDLFGQDPRCRQIAACLRDPLLFQAGQACSAQVCLSSMDASVHACLLQELQDVACRNVLVCTLDNALEPCEVNRVLDGLEKFPSVWYSSALQAFDTRWLTFWLQNALEFHLPVHSFEDVMVQMADCERRYWSR